MSPDLVQSERFLALVAPGEPITFQTFDDSKAKDKKLARILHGILADHEEELARLNNGAGAGVFWTVNATDGRGRTAGNITRIRGVFADLDGAPLEPVLACPLKPHAITESSPGRWHVYWRVVGLALDQFEGVQRAIAARFNGDKSVHDLPRVMRLPGFWHRKGEPFLTKIIQENPGQPYTAEQILAEFPPITDKPPEGKPVLGDDPVLKALHERGLYKEPKHGEVGAHHILCPWHEEHTTGTDGTIYFEPHTGRYSGGGFKCQHSHCSERTIADLREALGITVTDEAPIPNWPELPEGALYGVAGELTRFACAESEADPAAVLMTFLTWAGALIGNGTDNEGAGAHYMIGQDRHEARLFVALVGATARARKGTSKGLVEHIMKATEKKLEDIF